MSGFVLYVAPDGGLCGGVEYFDCDVERAWRNYLALAMEGA